MAETQKELIKDKVYLMIRDMILLGKIKPNTFIGEEQLASELKVSRTPIRNAFHRLQAEQILEIIPYRGVLVKKLATTEAAEIYDMRSLLEKRSANSFCKNKTLQIPERMHDIIDEMNSAPLISRQVELDLEFHRLIVQSTCNQILLHVYDSIEARKVQAAMLLSTKAANSEALSEHKAILGALNNKDADLACALLSKHFQREIGLLISENYSSV